MRARSSRLTKAISAPARLAVLASGLILALAMAGPGRAAEPAAKVDPAFRAAMKRFLVAQNIPSQLGEQMTYSAAEQALSAMAGSGVTITEPMQAIVIEEARADFGKKFGDVEYLSDLYSGIYVNHFSVAEIDELASFWESPIAKKFLSKSQTINEAFMVEFQKVATTLNASFQTRVEKRLREAGVLGNAP